MEFTSSDALTASKTDKGGCHVTTAVGFLMLLLSLAIAVGVGVIVHFAGGNREVTCNCLSAVGPSITDAASLKYECKKLALSGDTELCGSCPDPTSTSTAPTTTPPSRVTDVRLPRSLYPLYYDVELRPNMYSGPAEDFTFDGHVRIQLRCDTPTNNVTLHSNQLTIVDGSVVFGAKAGTATSPSVERWEWDKERQFTIIHLSEMLTKDAVYFVKMNFTGQLKGDLHGLYLSSYERSNTTVYQATTQFSPTDARKAFPCFDEPTMKSYFNVTLVRKRNMKALSNMPVARTEDRGDNWVADVFYSTPKMATYVLAFIVCDFEFKNTTKNNITYRAWSRPEAVDQTEYALDISTRILNFFQDYFQVLFPLPKQDMIAIPDISVGGMENWGLITYSESAMLYEPEVTSEKYKQRVTEVVSHELAHQWFGDLVSPAWWDDLWLKEGFASYMGYVGADFIHPDWKMFDQFVVNEIQSVFSFDGLVSSHPVYVPVGHPDEISEIFDSIAYNKGCSIIRMMQFFLGETTFKRGLTRYLNTKAYGAAFHDELWQAMTEQAMEDGKNLNVKLVMDTWLLQMNYPVVMVTREGNNRIRISQDRFLQDPTATDPGKYTSEFNYKWEIPFTFTSSKEAVFNKTEADIIWLKQTSSQMSFESQAPLCDQSDSDCWILGNIQQYGYYRVHYDTMNWKALINQLKSNHTRIHPTNRAQIINDAFSLAKAGMLSHDIALQAFEYLHKEMDYVPWVAATRELGYINSMLSLTELNGAYQEFVKSIIEDLYNTLGMNNTGATHLESYLRESVVSKACSFGVKTCIDEATRLYKQWMNDEKNNPIDPVVKNTVYCAAVGNGGAEEWDFAYRQYKATSDPAESSQLLAAMSCSGQPWILSRFLSRALSREHVRKQDSLTVLQDVSQNPVGQSLTWDFFRNNWDFIRKEYGSAFFAFPRLIEGITSSFNTDLKLQEVKDFIAAHPDLGSGTRAFQQAIERTQTNIKWMRTNMESVKSWLIRLGFQTI